MAVPYTKGKKGSTRSGGHTSIGNTPAPNNSAGSTSKANNRTGTLKKRTHGMGNTGYPK